jgi:NAD-dependent deacetylase
VAEDLDAAIDRATDAIMRARHVIALTGAGLSVESGIPPFRGPGGLWTKHGEPPMNGFQRFLADPKQAWQDRLTPHGPMRELWDALAAARPNPGHVALADLEALGVLKALITQNVDDLHRQAGSKRLLEIHGNATLVRCLECVARFPNDAIRIDVLPPTCPRCRGLLKSDTVSFGEPIPPDVLRGCQDEAERADCVLVAGTSATVYPAAQFPISVHERGGTLIEVNPHPSEITSLCSVSLRAESGLALPQLAQRVRARLARH